MRLPLITLLLLLLQCPGLDLSAPLSWPTLGLVLVSGLKSWEARRAAEHRQVVLLQLLAIGLLAAQQPGLLSSLLQLITALCALAGLLARELGEVRPWRELLRRSVQLLSAALPLALVLFLLLPRIPPLWSHPSALGQRGSSGLSAELDPLGISALARVDAPAARMRIEGATLPSDNAYWRVLVHGNFDGRRWLQNPAALTTVKATEPASPGPLQWWTLEPSRTRAVPWDGASRPASANLQLQANGVLLLRQPPIQQRSLRLQTMSAPLAWQQEPPNQADLQWPDGQEPQLERLAAQWRALPSPQERLAAAERWFRSQPFRYSLEPGSYGTTGLDAFLFDRQVGFCGHYASALAALMRSADVPARVVSGYQGGRLVRPIGSRPYLEIRQSDAHAWVEVWLEPKGWTQVDPTTWIATSNDREQLRATGGRSPAWLQGLRWLQWQWWGLDLSWTQWWLGFDPSSRTEQLKQWFGDQQSLWGLVLLALSVLAVRAGLRWMRWSSRKRWGSPLERSVQLLEQLGCRPQPGESFACLCARTAAEHPLVADVVTAMAQIQQDLAHAPLSREERLKKQKTWSQLRNNVALQIKRSINQKI